MGMIKSPSVSIGATRRPRKLRKMKIDRRVSTAHLIYEALRRRILDFTLVPGAPLSQKETAEEFGVSLSPVRDATLRLDGEGLVNIVPQSKTSVSLIDIQHARETHFLRLSLEIQVLRQLAHSITDVQMAAMRNWVDHQKIEIRAQDVSSFKIADNQFHHDYFGYANVAGLWQLIRDRRGHYDRLRQLYLTEPGRREIVVGEHEAIIAALANRDPGAAESAVRTHLGKSLAIVDEIRAQFPDYFL